MPATIAGAEPPTAVTAGGGVSGVQLAIKGTEPSAGGPEGVDLPAASGTETVGDDCGGKGVGASCPGVGPPEGVEAIPVDDVPAPGGTCDGGDGELGEYITEAGTSSSIEMSTTSGGGGAAETAGPAAEAASPVVPEAEPVD